ncbi:MAG: hypothetical protein K2M44_05925 [Clostridia bacterium]|nr:hypothetical protein [Clostridia bacterium]
MILMGFWDKLNKLFSKEEEKKEPDTSAYLGAQDEMYGSLDKIKAEYDAAVEAGKHKVEDEWPEDPGYEYLEYEGASKDDIVKDTSDKYDALLADKLADLLVEYGGKRDNYELNKTTAEQSADSKKQEIEVAVSSEKRDMSNRLTDRGTGRSSMYYETDKAYDNALVEAIGAVDSSLKDKLSQIDMQLAQLAAQKQQTEDELNTTYSQKKQAETESLLAAMQKQLDSIAKYNNNIKAKTVKYQMDRNKAIRKQAEEEAKAARETAKYESLYGYVGDKKTNYERRLQTAIDFYTSLPKEVAVKLVNNNPTVAGYLGLYYSRLVDAVGAM